MANDVLSGMNWSSTLPSWQRTYYEGLLLETLRTRSIMVPFTIMKEDFAAKQTGLINYSEVYDTEPNWNPLSEQDIWLRGAYLDSRSLTIGLEIHGDTLKFSDYADIVQYINRGDLRGLVREKIGQNQIDTLDILARNAFLSHPYPVYAGGARADRGTITSGDLFDPEYGELARTHLEEHEIPGVVATDDSDVRTIACVTTPRVVHDIRTKAGSKWLEVNEYAGSARKFSGEVGTYAGVRYIRSNRLMLRNHGAVTQQTTLAGATVPGQGSAATVDVVYSPGQSNSTRFITLTSATGFAVGDIITLHADMGENKPPVETDGTQETRRIVAINGEQVSLDKPLLKPHANLDKVTKGITLHASIFMGGPAVVYAVGERPTPIMPPKFDDLMMINRVGWRGYFKFQMFRPEFIELHLTAGSTN